jgi:hypothetical protein
MSDHDHSHLSLQPSHGFEQALRAFLGRPTVAGWEALIRALPVTQRHQASREAVLRARAQGVDATLLFHCLLRTGPACELLDLVESGAVDPGTVASAAQDAAPTMKPLWWALAAQAAQLRGQLSRAELLLHRAVMLDPEHPGVRVVMSRMARRQAAGQGEAA